MRKTVPSFLGNPTSVVYNSQLHVLCRDQQNTISDIWFDPAGSVWRYQNLNSLASSSPLAQDDPSSVSFFFTDGTQQHVVYRDINNEISDIWYNGSTWQYQNLSQMVSDAPIAQGSPFAVIFNGQMHVLYWDINNEISDIWFDSVTGQWNYQNLNAISTSTAAAADGNPCSIVFYQNQQQHVVYKDVNENISDIWYNSSTSQWQYQNISSLSSAPVAAHGDPFVFVYFQGVQQHNIYRDVNNKLSDIWYNSAEGIEQWFYQNLNTVTSSSNPPLAQTKPSAVDYQHDSYIFYHDVNNQLSEFCYNVSSESWSYSNINTLLSSAPKVKGIVNAIIYDENLYVLYRDSNNQISAALLSNGAWSYLSLSKHVSQQVNSLQVK